MYLKSIEIQGFKSFASKFLLEFHNGITAIVGPNGSGKSNISDAVRWVLGEQSAKQLRGSSMQDVIFAGTAERKPLSFAYVAITMDNSDHVIPVEFEEVTVARRVYRSGESEYLLNGTACRLRDIQELFYDTGIGKEGYSIIGQGQIERILSGKPEERRELFDEAVGIVKYKKRKAAAQKKLDDERANMERVSDILRELESRVGPLEKQASDARTFLRLKEEQKSLDLGLFLLDKSRLSDELSKAEAALLTVQTETEEKNRQAEALREEYSALSEAVALSERQLDALRRAQADTAAEKSRLEGEIALMEERIRSAEASDENLAARKSAIAYDEENHRAQLAVITRELSDLKAALAERSKAVRKADEGHQAAQAALANLAAKTEALRADEKAQQDLASALRQSRERILATSEQVALRKAELTAQVLSSEGADEGEQSALLSSQTEFERARELLSRLEEEETKLEERLLDWEEKTRENNASLLRITEQYHRQTTRYESLRNLAERYEGYNLAIKSVMEQKQSHPGILGVISDLITTSAEYETAIETALGGSIQNIVTADESDAKEMVSFLKQNRLGRATFLPLVSVDRRISQNIRQWLDFPGVVGLAEELVDCDERFRGVARYLLGRCLVADHIDHAVALAKKSGYSLHIVTLEGEYLSPGGSISGGRYKNSSNLLGRRRELDDLEKEIASLTKEKSALEARAEEIEMAVTLLTEDRVDLAARRQEAALSCNTARLKAEQLSGEQEKKEESRRQLLLQREDSERQLGDLASDGETIERQIAESETEQAHIEQALSDAGLEQTRLAKEEERAAETLAAERMEEAALSQRIEFAEENLSRIQDEIARDQENLQSLISGAQNAKEQIAERRKDIERLREEIKKREEMASEQKASLEAGTRARDEAAEKSRGLFARQEALSEELRRLDRESMRLSGQEEKARTSLEASAAYIWDEYELTPHAVEDLVPDPPADRAPLKKRLVEIREEIRSLGPVNVSAIEEFAEVGERYTFLSGQHQDLIEAEKTLLQIIDDLDKGMRKQFEEGFVRIRTEFDAAFRELFGGGHGTLELVEDEDVLDAGIRIIAQPPGKKLQNMMQLSGGEKSLTAIALLFGIQNMKPSPFALLDEIEAALDDSNVDRFAGYLHKLTENTQFIVITHRRGTMNAADRLYGITMQERGISTLVSVNLVEADLD